MRLRNKLHEVKRCAGILDIVDRHTHRNLFASCQKEFNQTETEVSERVLSLYNSNASTPVI